MFNFFKKDPLKKLETRRKALLEEAMHIQRSGNLRLYADKIVEISKIEMQMDDLKVSDTLTGTAKEVSDASQFSKKAHSKRGV